MNKQSCINAISMIFVFNLQYDSSALFLFQFVFALLSLHCPSYLSLKGEYIDV